MKLLVAAMAFSIASIASIALAQQAHHGEYAGQEGRAIKALSDAEVADYLAGKGMGFSKVAELNSRPGPAHVLQLAKQLQLTPGQLEQVDALHRQMQADAIVLAKQFIQKEAALQSAVVRPAVSEEEVARLIADAAETQGRLRAVHVVAHLKTAAILRPEQIAKYDTLQGYQAARQGEGKPDAEARRHHH